MGSPSTLGSFAITCPKASENCKRLEMEATEMQSFLVSCGRGPLQHAGAG